jgi:hypothetical protein
MILSKIAMLLYRYLDVQFFRLRRRPNSKQSALVALSAHGEQTSELSCFDDAAFERRMHVG